MTTQTAHKVLVSGPQYVDLATKLLQRARLASPTGGLWEAADVQWWSRQARFTDLHEQAFWLDGDERPVAAAIRTDFDRAIQFDVLLLPDQPGYAEAAWAEAIGRADAAAADGGAVEFPVRDDDALAAEALTAAGYMPADAHSGITSWLDAADKPQVPQLARGLWLMSREEVPLRPHPLIARNGADVAKRLDQCSLYNPALDLMVSAPDGKHAGYGLFWADPVTKVGLVEPLRTEEKFQHHGVASHVLATGLELLAQQGCERFKVSSDLDLYLKAGFQPLPESKATTYIRRVEEEEAPTEEAAGEPAEPSHPEAG